MEIMEITEKDLKLYKSNRSDIQTVRAVKLHSGDVIYCNTVFMKELGYSYELELGRFIFIYPKDNRENTPATAARVIKVIKEKTNKDKRWWQFWIKQEEYVTGYHLMVV